MSERVILSIGTKKGLFVAEAARIRQRLTLRGPFCPGVAVYAGPIDTRGTPRIYASSRDPFFGMKILRSTDLGKTFKETKSAPAFPKDDGRAPANIWSIEAGKSKRELWCGVEPASLFRSDDGGDSWEMVSGISNHAHARQWQPGNGGLCMHTILREGNRIHLGISTGGHYLSEDGGETFAACNTGIGVGFNPDPYPEFGQCVPRSPATKTRRAGSTCKTTAAGPSGTGRGERDPISACSAATTTERRGSRSARGSPPISAFRSSSTRTTPTSST